MIDRPIKPPLPIMIMQQPQQSNEELCNLLTQSLIAKDEKLLQKVLEQEDEAIIKDVINRVPVSHVRKLVLALRDQLSTKVTVNHLQWLQHLLALKYSVISTMADGRSILIPLVSLLDDKSCAAYYNKMQGLKGKLSLLKQVREARRADRAETVVRVQGEPEQQAQMEVDSETDTESEEEFENESDEEAIVGQAGDENSELEDGGEDDNDEDIEDEDGISDEEA